MKKLIEFIESLMGSFIENWAEERMDARKMKEIQRQMRSVTEEMMGRFADSSLDCDAFYSLVKSEAFAETLRLYYFSLGDRKGNWEYIANMKAYICRECPSVSPAEVQEFLSELKQLYEVYLMRVIEGDPASYALYQMVIRANRDILMRVSESEENLQKYIDAKMNVRGWIRETDIEEYHMVCEKRFSMVRFTGISLAEGKRIQNVNDFYVENSFSYYGSEFKPSEQGEKGDETLLCLGDFFKNGNKIVLIGAAGLGKSTTLNYFYCNYEQICGAYAVKIKIDLKECAEDIGSGDKDVLGCLVSDFYKNIKHDTLSYEDVERRLSGFLSQGRCLVIFDALDEIPTQSIRNKVRDEISSFCALYYLNRVIISTREVGYLQNRFDESFLHIRINEFGEEQIRAYSRNWYTAYYGENTLPPCAETGAPADSEAAFREFWSRFQTEARRARCLEMIRNPIILILALVIFDVEKSLPNRRVEFYKRCIETFLTEREDRKAAVKLSNKAKGILTMPRVVPHIAFHQFEGLRRSAGYKFTYEELQKAVFEAIKVKDADQIKWIAAVDEYDDYLVKRTELIREVDEDTLDFAHKTFYEYFLAVYFTKQFSPDELCGLLQEWIGDANYDEMAKLVIEVIILHDDPDRHERVMEFLFAQIEQGRNARAIFSILADLYTHNLLQPQFHEDYHKCILYHTGLLSPMVRHLNGRGRLFDAGMLAEMYRDALSEPDGFARTLDALYFLDGSFKNRVRHTLEQGIAYYTVDLMIQMTFAVKQLSSNGRISPSQSVSDTFQFFLHEGLPYTLKYPQIYCAVTAVMASQGDFSEVEKLLAPCFVAPFSARAYAKVSVIRSLLEHAIESPQQLLLSLIYAVRCAKDRTNIFLVDSFRMYRQYGEERDGQERLMSIVGWLWTALCRSENYAAFRRILTEQGLYSEDYADLYQTLYMEYVTNEKNNYRQYAEGFFGNVDAAAPDLRCGALFPANEVLQPLITRW